MAFQQHFGHAKPPFNVFRLEFTWNFFHIHKSIFHSQETIDRGKALLIGTPESGGRTQRDKKIHDFHNFSNSGLKFYMRISECICNRIMMEKNRFFDPFTGEAPLNSIL